MYKTIVLAFDGSEEGARALREGALLARACNAKVVLLSVVPESGGFIMAEGIQGGVVAQMIEERKELLARGLNRLHLLGCKSVARLEVGEPAPVIGKVACEVGADVVMVGHRKQSLLSRWWSGTNDAYITDHCGCSVVLCRNTISDAAFEAALADADAERKAMSPG